MVTKGAKRAAKKKAKKDDDEWLYVIENKKDGIDTDSSKTPPLT